MHDETKRCQAQRALPHAARATRPESRGTTPVENDGPVGVDRRKARDRRRGRHAASPVAPSREGSPATGRWPGGRGRSSGLGLGVIGLPDAGRVSGARRIAEPGLLARRSRVGTPYGGASAADWIAGRSSPHFPFQPRQIRGTIDGASVSLRRRVSSARARARSHTGKRSRKRGMPAAPGPRRGAPIPRQTRSRRASSAPRSIWGRPALPR